MEVRLSELINYLLEKGYTVEATIWIPDLGENDRPDPYMRSLVVEGEYLYPVRRRINSSDDLAQYEGNTILRFWNDEIVGLINGFISLGYVDVDERRSFVMKRKPGKGRIKRIVEFSFFEADISV